MEQLTTHKTNLPASEKKNVFLAVAVGALNTINNEIPGPPHQKRKRKLAEASQALLHHVAPRLPAVQPNNIELFKQTIIASETVLEQILADSGHQREHVLLNLVGFCMEELPVSKRITDMYNKLFDLWVTAHRYEDTRSGDRIFQRIESEVQILVAQRGGIII